MEAMVAKVVADAESKTNELTEWLDDFRINVIEAEGIQTQGQHYLPRVRLSLHLTLLTLPQYQHRLRSLQHHTRPSGTLRLGALKHGVSIT
jgi:hypothetical protein